MARPAQVLALPARVTPEHQLPQRRLHAPLHAVPQPQAAHQPHPAAKWIVRSLVLGFAILGPLLAFSGQKEVSLDVEGAVRTVKTYATNASDLLVRVGIVPGGSDLLSPGENVADGDEVTYRRAKSVRIVLDGEPKKVTARGLTVGDALTDLGLVPGPKDHVHPAVDTKLKRGMSVYVRNAIHANVRVDGRLRDVVSSADSVGNLLAQAGVTVGADDYVIPGRDAEPADGMWVRVVRVRRVVESRNVRIPFSYVTQRDPQMESGVRKVVQQGAEGLKVQKWRVVLEDGRRVSSTLLEQDTVRSSRNHIVRVGTKEPTFKGGGGSQTGAASWYRGDGLIAAHRSLPMGSIVKVTNLANGKSVAVRIADRGPWVDGRVIDLSDDAFERLAPLGKGTIKVKVQS
ncbi:MAG: ubiquitin-like domain-containing protein [Actinomycetota bacterium]